MSEDTPLRRFIDRLPFVGRFTGAHEREVAREQSARILELLREVQREGAGLEGEALYEQVVSRRLECDAATARDVVRQADLSYAQWPIPREVSFRDVAKLVIVQYLLKHDAQAMGTRSDLAEIVNGVIPADI